MKKAVLITGSTKGIGKAIGMRMLAAGKFVYFNYANNNQAAADLSNELDTLGYNGMYKIIKADMQSLQGVDCLIDEMEFDKHELWGVVLNASTNGKSRNSFKNITPEEMNFIFNANLFVPFFLLQKLSDRICNGGSIVFISSHVGVYPHSTYIPYGLTKSSEAFLARMLVKEFDSRQITVNSVAPAFIETDMFPGNRTEEHLNSIKSKIAAHRFGQPDEVAQIVQSVMENKYINGTVVSVDGGYSYK